MKTLVPTLLIIFSLTCFVFLSKSQGVVPPPDGGYAGGNTAEGHLALASLNTSAGLYNTAVGMYSLLSIIDGSFCTGVGAGSLLANTANENTATGAGALLSNTTGSLNTANGAFALFSNTIGVDNTALGTETLATNTTGSRNTAVGFQSLFSEVSGAFNTAVGASALASDTNGEGNNAFGDSALASNIDGVNNTAVGGGALFSNVDGASNNAVGFNALGSNFGGDSNNAVGFDALANNTTGNNNVALGDSAGFNVDTANDVICIGANVAGANESNSCYIGSIFGQPSPGGVPVLINANHKLGTAISSKRFKEDIKAMGTASEALFSLEPITFRYRKEIDPTSTLQLGLVAEDVEKVNSDLVVRDKEGKPYSVRYDAVNAMLLNEFLKEHRKVQEQQRELDSLKAELKEQRDLIQKVRDRVEMTEIGGFAHKESASRATL